MLLLTVSGYGYGQRYVTKNGNLKFEASTSTFEKIEATNKNTSSVLDASNGNLAVLTLMKGFRFKSALMEEHFNENYVESDKFPKASFKGVIEALDFSSLTSTGRIYKITGELTLHGKTKRINTTAILYKSSSGIIVIKGNFEVKPEDFGIEIPKIVQNKIAEKVSINYNLALDKQ